MNGSNRPGRAAVELQETSCAAAGRSCMTIRATGPPAVFGGRTTLHLQGGNPSYLLIPVIPT